MMDFVTFQILKMKGIKSNNIYSFDNSKTSRDFNSCMYTSIKCQPNTLTLK